MFHLTQGWKPINQQYEINKYANIIFRNIRSDELIPNSLDRYIIYSCR